MKTEQIGTKQINKMNGSKSEKEGGGDCVLLKNRLTGCIKWDRVHYSVNSVSLVVKLSFYVCPICGNYQKEFSCVYLYHNSATHKSPFAAVSMTAINYFSNKSVDKATIENRAFVINFPLISNMGKYPGT